MCCPSQPSLMPAFSPVLQLSGELNLALELLTSFWSWFSLKETRLLLVKEQTEGPRLSRNPQQDHSSEARRSGIERRRRRTYKQESRGWRQLDTGGGH